MSSHVEQVASVLKKAVQDILSRGLSDPRVRGLISVTQVKLSPDYAEAQVWVSVLPDQHAKLSIKGLQHAASHIRSQVSKSVALRRMPRLSFHLDDSLKKQAQVHAAINQALQDDRQLDEQHNDAPIQPGHQPEDTSQ
jgi:ribosome-binding factor A